MQLPEIDRVKEQIRFNTEMLKLFAVVLTGTVGGILALLIERVDTGIEFVCLTGGMIMAPVFVVVSYRLYTITQKLIRHGKQV